MLFVEASVQDRIVAAGLLDRRGRVRDRIVAVGFKLEPSYVQHSVGEHTVFACESLAKEGGEQENRIEYGARCSRTLKLICSMGPVRDVCLFLAVVQVGDWRRHGGMWCGSYSGCRGRCAVQCGGAWCVASYQNTLRSDGRVTT
jgi:hypothetical protein